jgi:hypothetical protein
MKKFTGNIVITAVLPKGHLAKGPQKQGENNKGKELPPQLVKPGFVLARGLAPEKALRHEKAAGFGTFTRGNSGGGCFELLYVPGKFRNGAEQHAGKEDKEDKNMRAPKSFSLEHRGHCIARGRLNQHGVRGVRFAGAVSGLYKPGRAV